MDSSKESIHPGQNRPGRFCFLLNFSSSFRNPMLKLFSTKKSMNSTQLIKSSGSEWFWDMEIGTPSKGRPLPKTIWYAKNTVSLFGRACLNFNTRDNPPTQLM